jgi:predicted DNA-binding protein (MmcQ/YjbR family)
VQWGAALCFKVDGKLFAVTRLEPAPVRLSFKATPENFVELCEHPGVRPAPYMARAQWVSLEQLNTLRDSELRALIAESYRLVWGRLSKKRRQQLQGAAGKLTAAPKAKKLAQKSNAKRARAAGK